MEKNLNKIEEMNEEIKVEELNEESLESVDGGSVTVIMVMEAMACIGGFGAACKGAWDLGQRIGAAIVGK